MHVEVTDPDVNAFDGEAVFIERHLAPLVRAFPALRTVLEHFTTSTAAELVSDAPDYVAATITAHHLLRARSRHAARLGDPPEVVRVFEIHFADPSVYSTNRSV